jgi:peroxiredoxin
LRDRYEEFTARGAKLVAIGMGEIAQAAHFKQDRDIPFPLLVDKTRQSYRALGMKVGTFLEVSGPRRWLPGMKSLITGHGGALPKQNMYQIGGVLVIDKGGEIIYEHRGKTAEDNPPVDDVLRALE